MAIPSESLLREFVRAFETGKPQSDKAVEAAVELVRAELNGRRGRGRPQKDIAEDECRRMLDAVREAAPKVAKGETRENAFYTVAKDYSMSESTLRRYWEKAKSLPSMTDSQPIASWKKLAHVMPGIIKSPTSQPRKNKR
ncbi:hypothetical protein HNO86_08460 [Pseudomonas sp. C1C7]|uniref:hypothetical protein n=1 Tax=Pseudomonas sp. C1C7 TaxID=2735272 RepID=UPI0015863C36|nr:hypothetical protein [Pseudomonas sp. C1C7]NUT75069.1 hypothetical protein [Pseudomonas sp. C1C7]